MKEFMMIFIGADYSELGLSPEEIQNRMTKWWAWNNKMQDQGILRGGHALEPEAKNISGESRTVSDGPFIEGKELVGGYYIIEVENMDKAVEVAQDFPDFELGGTVEIRPVMVFDK